MPQTRMPIVFAASSPDRKSTRLNSSHVRISYAVFCLKKKMQFPDTEAEDVPDANRELGRLRGFRSVLFTPLMNQGAPIGMISVTRAEPGCFFFNDTATTEIYTLSLHDALPIWSAMGSRAARSMGISMPRKVDCPDRKSTRLNSSHVRISYAVFCLKKKKQI